MTVGFFNQWMGDASHNLCADLMIRSVKRHMLGVDVVQFSDAHTSPIVGISRIRRRVRAPLALMIAEFWADCEGPWLFLDTDCLVCRDVREIFDRPFDIAVASRADSFVADEEQSEFMRLMPFNTGVVFSHSQTFWQEALGLVRSYPVEQQDWIGIQLATNQLIASDRYSVLELPRAFNFAPRTRDEELSPDAAILHYKGPGRKQWMIDRFMREALA